MKTESKNRLLFNGRGKLSWLRIDATPDGNILIRNKKNGTYFTLSMDAVVFGQGKEQETEYRLRIKVASGKGIFNDDAFGRPSITLIKQ
jgi:hypothetical protein